MNPAVVAALAPLAIDAGVAIIDGLIALGQAPKPDPERLAEAQRIQGDVVALEARMANDPQTEALLMTLLRNKRVELELALDGLRLAAEWSKISDQKAYTAGLTRGAIASARVLGPMVLEDAKRRAGAL